METPKNPKFQVLKEDTYAKLKKTIKSWTKEGYFVDNIIKCSDGFAALVWRPDQ